MDAIIMIKTISINHKNRLISNVQIS